MVDTLEHSIISRHSTRKFTSTSVPREILVKTLTLAQNAPSNSNTQPWRLYLASGAARDRLEAALLAAARSGAEPAIPPLPEAFRHYRSELGREVYGVGLGIARDDKSGHAAAVLRNFEFFSAPLVGIVCMDKMLDYQDALSVGMWLMTWLLTLTEHNVDSCVQVSVAGYPEVIRKELAIPEEMRIICGVAIGHADKDSPVNNLPTRRDTFEKCVTFIE